VTDEHLVVEDDGAVRTLRLNRPDRLNALTEPLLDHLREEIIRAGDDPAVGIVVLTGTGRAFCAGGDLGPMAERQAGDPSAGLRHSEVALLLRTLRKPTIAVVNGPAAGAGASIAFAADMRVMADSAFLTAGFGLVGLSGDFGGTYSLLRLVGVERATRFYMLNERWDAATALAYGAVGEVVPLDELDDAVRALAQRLAAGSAPALAGMKHNLRMAEHVAFADLLRIEALAQEELMTGEDFREGARAFAEGRAPAFRQPASDGRD
jgi:2-(1,2-epoxy-1,2-dihydrophenyl)acetyl-CoA isomerase